MKKCQRTVWLREPCVTKESISCDTCSQTESGHFIHNLVFTKQVLMIPTKTCLRSDGFPIVQCIIKKKKTCCNVPAYLFTASCLPKFSPASPFPSTNYNYAIHSVIDYVM